MSRGRCRLSPYPPRSSPARCARRLQGEIAQRSVSRTPVRQAAARRRRAGRARALSRAPSRAHRRRRRRDLPPARRSRPTRRAAPRPASPAQIDQLETLGSRWRTCSRASAARASRGLRHAQQRVPHGDRARRRGRGSALSRELARAAGVDLRALPRAGRRPHAAHPLAAPRDHRAMRQRSPHWAQPRWAPLMSLLVPPP